MKTKRSITFLSCLLNFWVLQAYGQTKVILDSDASSDWDDVGDIAVLNSLADLGDIEILATMASSQNGGTALFMNAINTWYGRPNVPVGRRPDAKGPGGYPAQIANEYPHPSYATYTDPPLAANLYRQILAGQPDNSVVIVTTGYLNNLQALLQSGPDAYSSLDGFALVAKKIKYWVAAGGDFPRGGEFNLTVEPAAAQYVVNNWPAGVVYVGFTLGGAIFSGWDLDSTPVNNPVRRVYVDIEKDYPHPTWGQIAVYYAGREAESQNLFHFVDVGRNNANADGTNYWTATPDPTGLQDQKYLVEIQRHPIEEAINLLVQQSGYPASGPASKPGQPTNIRATVVGGNRMDLQWTDNAYNETGFVIERKINGVFTQIASVGANVNSYSDTGLSTTSNVGYRIKAINAQGSSGYTTKTVFGGGWTEFNLSDPSDTSPIYNYYQYDDLNWSRPGPTNHLTVNNDSTHGTDLTIDMKVSGQGSYGPYFIYFLYQDQKNWYRLSAGMALEGQLVKFEKSINGVITQIGATAPGVAIGPGIALQDWRVTLNPAGQMQFFHNENPNDTIRTVRTLNLILSASDSLSFSSGKIALGSTNGAPVWQNFSFDTTSAPTSTPSPTPTSTPSPTPTSTPSPNPTSTPSPSPTSTAAPGMSVKIVAQHSGMALELKNINVEQQPVSTSSAQLFTVQTLPNGKTTILSGSKCMSAGSASTGVLIADCADNLEQQFLVTQQAGGSVEIRSSVTGYCFDVAYGDSLAGRQLVQYNCNGAANQRFKLTDAAATPAPTSSPTPAPSPTSTPAPSPSPSPSPTSTVPPNPATSVKIVAKHSGMALEVKSINVVQQPVSTSSAQLFTVQTLTNGKKKILSSTKCMSAGSASTGVLIADCVDSFEQQFVVTQQSDGTVEIRSSVTGYCFDVAYGDSVAGRQLVQYNCNGAANQRFKVSAP